MPRPATLAGKVMKFVEKPSAEDLGSLQRDEAKREGGSEFLANMGIYVFKREALLRWVGPGWRRGRVGWEWRLRGCGADGLPRVAGSPAGTRSRLPQTPPCPAAPRRAG